MKLRHAAFLGGTILLLIIFASGAGLVSAGSGAFSVGFDAYTVGKVSLSPTEAYIGDTVAATGSGEIANATFDVYMGGTYEGDGQDYYAYLGSTTTDAGGNWSYVFTVPSKCTRDSDGAEIDLFAAIWPVGGWAFAGDSVYFSWSDPDLTVYGERPVSSSGSSGSTTWYSSTLPYTGFPAMPAGAGLFGGGLMLTGAARWARIRIRARQWRESGFR